jgi:O-antigen/teichoic acid export membrane protein
MLLALGETPAASAITFASVVTSLVLAFLLLPFWGVVGAAVARGFAMVLTTALTLIFLGRKIRLELDLEAIWKSLIAGGVMAVVVLGVQMFMYNRFLLRSTCLSGHQPTLCHCESCMRSNDPI